MRSSNENRFLLVGFVEVLYIDGQVLSIRIRQFEQRKENGRRG
jgi:hypothetical protein